MGWGGSCWGGVGHVGVAGVGHVEWGGSCRGVGCHAGVGWGGSCRGGGAFSQSNYKQKHALSHIIQKSS